MPWSISDRATGSSGLLHFLRSNSAMRRPAMDLRRRKYVARRRKPSQNPFCTSWNISTSSQSDAMRCGTKPYHRCIVENTRYVFLDIPYRSIVRASGPEGVPLSYPDKTPISVHRTALPRERHNFPVKNCQNRSFPGSSDRVARQLFKYCTPLPCDSSHQTPQTRGLYLIKYT